MNELRRAIVRSAVQKGIRNIQEDPKRGIRKMVDLGSHFSHGRFQQRIFAVMQKELTNPDSAYYAMVTRVVCHTKPEYLEQFGINVGYNSWTHGAQVIRAHEAVHGYNVPWCLVLNLRGGLEFDLDDLMRQGEKMGIYCYMIFAGDAGELAEIYPILYAHKDSAVFLMLREAALPQVNVENVENVMLLLPAEDAGTVQSAEELRARQCLFGLWMEYGDEDADATVSGEVEEKAAELGAPLVLAVPQTGASEETRKRVAQYSRFVREHKKTPALMADFYSVIEEIDCIISVEPCMLGVNGDGTVFTAQGEKKNLSIVNISLEDVLMCTMPRVTYLADKEDEGVKP